MFEVNPLFTFLFFSSLLVHFYNVNEIVALNVFDIPRIHCCDNYNHFDNSLRVDIRYVILVMVLLMTKNFAIMSLTSCAIFMSGYLSYIKLAKSKRNNFSNIVALSLFMQFWFSLYFGVIEKNEFVCYLMLTISLFVSTMTI